MGVHVVRMREMRNVH